MGPRETTPQDMVPKDEPDLLPECAQEEPGDLWREANRLIEQVFRLEAENKVLRAKVRDLNDLENQRLD